jgi:hypothetical protein
MIKLSRTLRDRLQRVDHLALRVYRPAYPYRGVPRTRSTAGDAEHVSAITGFVAPYLFAAFNLPAT